MARWSTQSTLPFDAHGRVGESFELVLEKFSKKQADKLSASLTNLLKKSFRLLVSKLGDRASKTATWEEPKLTIRYPVQVTFENGLPRQLSVGGFDGLDPREGFAKIFEEQNFLPFFTHLSRSIVVILDGADGRVVAPIDLMDEHRITPESAHQFVKSINFPVKGRVPHWKTKKKSDFEIAVAFRFNPLVVDTVSNNSYYSLSISLDVNGLALAEWEPKARMKILANLESLLKWSESFGEHLPEEPSTSGLWFLDRTTVKDFLTAVGTPIEGSLASLPDRIDLLKAERERLGVERLTFKQKRELLSKQQEYIDEGFLIRDYGSHCLSCPLSEVKYLTSRYAKPLATALLGYGYMQGSTEVRIPKATLLSELGYSSKDRQAYTTLRRTLLALTRLEVHSWNYDYTPVKRVEVEDPGEVPLAVGHFLDEYDGTNHKTYNIRINPKWYGCVRFLSDGDRNTRTKEQRKKVFGQRGILPYPGEVAKSQGKAHQLAHYLVTNRGNAKLSTSGYKVFSFKMETWAEIITVRHSRSSRRFRDTLKILKEWSGCLYDKVEPKLSNVEKLPPSKGLETVVRLWVIDDAELLNKRIVRRRKRKVAS